jgi:hypothetical protein
VTIVARRAIDPDLRYLQSSRAVQSYSDRAALRLVPMETPSKTLPTRART